MELQRCNLVYTRVSSRQISVFNAVRLRPTDQSFANAGCSSWLTADAGARCAQRWRQKNIGTGTHVSAWQLEVRSSACHLSTTRWNTSNRDRFLADRFDGLFLLSIIELHRGSFERAACLVHCSCFEADLLRLDFHLLSLCRASCHERLNYRHHDL